MSNYSDKPGSVRVDFFKESGKWYATEAVDMTGEYEDWNIWEALKRHFPRRDNGTFRYSGMWAVCLNPYSKHAHPVMFKVPDTEVET